MPFKRNGKIEVTNNSKHPIIIFYHFLGAEYKKLPEDTLYFHARWNREDPPEKEKDISVEIEHGQRIFNEAKADFTSTAFWYQKEPHKPFAPVSTNREPTVTVPGFIIPVAIEFEGTPGTQPYYVSTYNGGWLERAWRN